MEQHLDWNKLINAVYLQILPNLSDEELLRLKLASKKTKEVVRSYMIRDRTTLLSLPTNIKYTAQNIKSLKGDIKNACQYFRKEPKECDMTLNCRVFHSNAGTLITSNPPLNALIEIGETGVKIDLNVIFDVESSHSFGELWLSYILLLIRILDSLPYIQSISIDFSRYEIQGGWIGGDWFERTAAMSLINLQELSSLRISGKAPWVHILNCLPNLTHLRKLKLKVYDNYDIDHEQLLVSLSQMTQLTSLGISGIQIDDGYRLFACLSLMPQLGSVSLSELKINFLVRLVYQHFGQMIVTTLPNLVKLKLSNSFVEAHSILELLPHIRPLLSKLTSLNLSNNNLDAMNVQYLIEPVKEDLSNLRSLNLSDNYICRDASDPNPLIPLIQSLPKLEKLVMWGNEIDDNCIRELIPTLQDCRSLRKLDLSKNKISTYVIVELTRKLKFLKVLDVTDNLSDDNETLTDMDSLD